MSHPFHHLREVHAGRKKAHERHYARGGKVHDDEVADKKLFNKLIAEHHAKEPNAKAAVHKHEKHMHKGEKETKLKAGGAVGKPRLDRYARGGKVEKFARGGKTKHKGTHINIAVVAPHGPRPPAGVAPPAALPPPGGGGPLPPGMPPGMPPGGGPPMPGMKRGGRASGGHVFPKIPYGAGTGMERKAMTKIAKAKRHGG